MNLRTSGWQPDTPVDNIAVLVTQPQHPRFSQLGKLEAHDWKEYGVYFIRFADGKREQCPDGLCKGDPPSPVTLFYRHRDERGTGFDSDDQIKGPVGLMDAYLKMSGGTISSFQEQYKRLFEEEFQLLGNTFQ